MYAIATSGDAARVALFQGAVGQKVWFMGEDQDLSFFEPPAIVENPLQITRVPLAQAEGIVCCGPFDRLADPAANRPDFLLARERGLKLLCANPDLVVDRGGVREWCAGALARLYDEMGGQSLYFGKPHPPIYDLARMRLGQTGLNPVEARILAIGDGNRHRHPGRDGRGYRQPLHHRGAWRRPKPERATSPTRRPWTAICRAR